MATTTINPTILFVHGSWHQPSHFAPAREVFEAAGFSTSCPLLPSFGSLPPVGLKEDAQCVRDELTRLVEREGRDVVVVGHSYGGVVITEAVDEAFGRKRREKEGTEGGVVGLLFMCAFLLPLHVSLAGALGGSLPPFIEVRKDGMCMMMDPANRFYHDVPDAEHWVGELMWCPAIAQETALSYTSYLYHPVTYLYAENDQALPVEVQRMMVNNVSLASGIEIKTESLSSSHSPFLSMPKRVLEVVERMVWQQA